MPFKHGITLTEISTGARTLTAVSTAILGLVATAPALMPMPSRSTARSS
jgi:phage tail sheath protein FI